MGARLAARWTTTVLVTILALPACIETDINAGVSWEAFRPAPAPYAAEIAADVVRSWQRFRALFAEPVDDGLREAMAHIAVKGSESYGFWSARAAGLAIAEERFVDVVAERNRIEIESVQVAGSPPYEHALVTVCEVFDQWRVDRHGVPVQLEDWQRTPTLIEPTALRRYLPFTRTPYGWLADYLPTNLWAGEGETDCPPSP